jgi:hypothetical protein
MNVVSFPFSTPTTPVPSTLINYMDLIIEIHLCHDDQEMVTQLIEDSNGDFPT